MDKEDIKKIAAQELGLQDMPEGDREKILEQFGENTLQAVSVAVLSALPRDKQEEFGKLSEAGDASAIASFLQANIPDLNEVVQGAVQEEVRKFKEFQKSLG